MAITRLNHAVLYVRDAEKSAEFYGSVFDMEPIAKMPGAVFLKARASNNDHDLGLFSIGDGAQNPGRGTHVGLYHLAWQVDTLSDLEKMRDALAARSALVGATDHGATKSVYGFDPDHIEFEVMWIVPEELLRPGDEMKTVRLDLEKEIERFGADTPSRVLAH